MKMININYRKEKEYKGELWTVQLKSYIKRFLQ